MSHAAPVTVRPITPDELVAWHAHTNRAFAGTPDAERTETFLRPVMRYEDALGAFDGDEVVGTAHQEPSRMAMPGGAWLACAGVTRVSVAPTHRRRGILRRLMTQQLEAIREQGIPLAALWASESPIYGRFGYGLATIHERWRIAREHGRLADWAPEPEGEVRFLEASRWREVLPPIFERYASTRPGGMQRIEYRWTSLFEDRDRNGMSPLQGVVFRTEEGIDGYALYRARGAWPNELPAFELRVEELIPLSTAAELALWRYLLNVDLVATVTAHDQPVDATLPWALADFRRLERHPQDAVYLRVLDIPGAFEARAYQQAGRLVLEVVDPMLADAGGRFAVDASPEGAHVTRTSEEPDLRLHAPATGPLLLGTQPPTLLGRAGLIDELRPGSLRRADSVFSWPVSPHTVYHF